MVHYETYLRMPSLWTSGGLIAFLVLVCASIHTFYKEEKPYSGFPLYGKRHGEIFNTKAKKRFQASASTILKDASAKV